MDDGVRVLLISGSLRAGSTNTAALLTARAVAPDRVDALLYGDLDQLPHFNPDDDVEPLHPAVASLRALLRDSDAVLVSTPEYAGALPGSFKNLLDWTVGDAGVHGRPTAWINASSSPLGATAAHESLRRVLTYTEADLVDEACVAVPVRRDAIGPDGVVTDPATRAGIADAVEALVARVDERRRR